MHIWDHRHRSWLSVTALISIGVIGLHAAASWNEQHPLGGGSTLGLWLGIFGSVLMLYVSLIFVALRQRDRRLPTTTIKAAGYLFASLLLFPLRFLPAWHSRPRSWWLRAHVWIGLFSVVVILCHSGYRWGGWLTVSLWAILILLVASGAFGLVMQQFLPHTLGVRFPHEAPYGQIPHMRRVAASRAGELLHALEPDAAEERATFQSFAATIVQHFGARERLFASDLALESYFENFRFQIGWIRLDNSTRQTRIENLAAAAIAGGKKWDVAKVDELLDADPPQNLRGRAEALLKTFDPLPTIARDLATILQDRWLDQLEELCRQSRSLYRQERIHHWLHGWLIFHISLSVMLLILGVTHAIVAMYY